MADTANLIRTWYLEQTDLDGDHTRLTYCSEQYAEDNQLTPTEPLDGTLSQLVLDLDDAPFIRFGDGYVQIGRGRYPHIVMEHFCSLCAAKNRFGLDGEGDCIHKQILREWTKYQMENGHPAMPDVDDRREAYYEAGEYPPAVLA